MAREVFEQAMDRRGFLRLAGGGAMAAATLSVLSACAPARAPAAGGEGSLRRRRRQARQRRGQRSRLGAADVRGGDGWAEG